MELFILFIVYLLHIFVSYYGTYINFTVHHVLFSSILYAICYLEIMSLFLFPYIVDAASANRGIF